MTLLLIFLMVWIVIGSLIFIYNIIKFIIYYCDYKNKKGKQLCHYSIDYDCFYKRFSEYKYEDLDFDKSEFDFFYHLFGKKIQVIMTEDKNMCLNKYLIRLGGYPLKFKTYRDYEKYRVLFDTLIKRNKGVLK